MSWHCLFCSSAEHWMRGIERKKNYGMGEIWFNNGLGGKKISLGVAHADCFKRVLKKGEREYLINGDLSDFDELDKFTVDTGDKDEE